MPYLEPVSNPAASVATISVQDTSWAGEESSLIQLTTGQFGMGGTPVEQTEALFQKILEAVAAHPDLEVVESSRSYRVDQSITP